MSTFVLVVVGVGVDGHVYSNVDVDVGVDDGHVDIDVNGGVDDCACCCP